MIYFLRLESGLIKIGRTKNFVSRMSSHKSSGPFDVLGVHDGGFREEYAVHQRFDHLRAEDDSSSREWFHPGQDLLEYIERECRQPSHADPERGYVTTKIDVTIYRKAKVVAAARNLSLAEYLSRLLRTPVDECYAEEVIKAGTVPKAKRK